MAEAQPTILVTGGAGYIGAHTCLALAEAGFTPVVYDNLGAGHREFVQWGPLEEGDLLDAARLGEVFRRHRPSAVVHFAALALVGESVENPGKYYRNNVVGSLNLLEAMRDAGAGRIVFSSTCATYGEPEWNPLTETHPQRPISPYGDTKLTVERMLAAFGAAHGIRAVALRYFNAAGADPERRIGEDHDPETHLIPIALDVALGRRPELAIFGEDYDTPDGTCVRDYIHVADLAAAHVLALQYLDRGGGSAQFNLGNGLGFSVREVIETARAATGHAIPARAVPRRPGDPPSLIADAALARETLGWTPRYPDLETIVEHAWAWHRKRFSG